MLSLVVIILLHTQTSFSQSEEWTMFFTREKKVLRPISQHNKRKQKHNDQILLSLYFCYACTSWQVDLKT